MKLRKIVIWLTGLLLLAMVNVAIWKKEQLLAHGRPVLLPLMPVDPRSLMQGDYMRLRFALERDMPHDNQPVAADGYVVVKLDAQGVAAFARLSDTAQTTLAAEEQLLRYRFRESQVKFATNAYFFQEGQAGRYQTARYGEFRASPAGELLLVGLRGPNLEKLSQ